MQTLKSIEELKMYLDYGWWVFIAGEFTVIGYVNDDVEEYEEPRFFYKWRDNKDGAFKGTDYFINQPFTLINPNTQYKRYAVGDRVVFENREAEVRAVTDRDYLIEMLESSDGDDEEYLVDHFDLLPKLTP